MHSYKQEWYGDKAKVIRSDGDTQIIDYGCPRKGIITNIAVFPGIQISLMEMETDAVFPSNAFEKYLSHSRVFKHELDRWY